MKTMNPVIKYVLPGIALSAALTAIIAVTASNLTGFEIVGKTVPFAYPWRLTEPNAIARLTAWTGYLLHNILAWGIIYFAQRERPKYSNGLRWFNWGMIGLNIIFGLLHIAQTQLFYDGLAQDVPEITALGSVALMLIIIIILETPRRGLILGQKFKFKDGFMYIVRKYHSYIFTWAIIYDYWYHPTAGTFGHLMGFYYNFLLMVQATLLFNRAHLNKWWTFFLEAFVLIHAVAVAIFQGQAMWPMFAFGFGGMVILTQMYGLGLNTWAKRGLAAVFLLTVVLTYGVTGRFADIHEITRIPALDFMVVFLIYGVYLGINWLIGLFRRPAAAEPDIN